MFSWNPRHIRSSERSTNSGGAGIAGVGTVSGGARDGISRLAICPGSLFQHLPTLLLPKTVAASTERNSACSGKTAMPSKQRMVFALYR
jgi:hypothetical protein